jgi:hypothetical protein
MAHVDVWLQRLRHPDLVARREAIGQLELIGDPDVLGALAMVFAADPDPALRALARETGKKIYYLAIKRTTTPQAASLDDRQQAADILARARMQRQRRRR